MTLPHALPHAHYLELLDRHGRAALDALGALKPGATVPPHGADAMGYAREHLATLEIWAWLLEHPESDWTAYQEGPPPARYDEVVEAIGRARDRLTRQLVETGPDQEMDYFGRPGTSYDAARLLAHEAIRVASAAADAQGTAGPPLPPDVASDGVDHALAHWSEPGADVVWHPAPAHLVAADTGRSWWVRFGEGADFAGAIAPATEGAAALGVTDSAQSLLRWLEGYPATSVKVEGDDATLRTLRVALGHPVEPEPRRPWWRRG